MEPRIIISTDWHMKPSNLEAIYNLQEQELQEAEKLGITNHVWLGDIFDSRISQREETLNMFTKIINMYGRYGHHVYCLPGNHDKSNYESDTSFLDPYKYHPNFELVTKAMYYVVGGIPCLFIPFFVNEIWLDEFESMNTGDCSDNILFTHIAFDGSQNNDKSLVKSSIRPSMFKDWGLVLSGHYHDWQELSDNVIHLGSLTQNNFGEDENKGFWVVYDDLSYDLIPSGGKKFKKVIIDLNTTTFKQVDKIVKSFKDENPNDLLRVEFKGNKDELSSINKKAYQELGVDVKVKLNEVEVTDVESKEIKVLSSNDIVEKFKVFCDENDYNYEEGLSILEQAL